MINPEKLNEVEKDAFEEYADLREAYRLAVTKNVMDSNYLGDINARRKARMEKYNPTPREAE